MQTQGQITLIDYNDAVSVQGTFAPSKALTQIRTWTGPDTSTLGTTSFAGTPTVSGTFPAITITPHANNQRIIPSLFKAGSATDLLAPAQSGVGIDDVKWTLLNSTVATKLEYTWTKATNHWQKSTNGGAAADLTLFYQDSTVGYFNPRVPCDLTLIADIVAEATPLSILFECSYTDPATQLKVYSKQVITIQMVVNSQSTPYVDIFAPDGQWIRNGSPASIRLIAELYRNGTKDSSWTASSSCEWFVYDSTHAADDGAGAYWDKLSHVVSNTEISTVDSVTGITTGGNQLKVFDAVVVGTETYKVKIVENGVTFYATVNVTDLTDALQTTIDSTGGNILRNGAGSTTLTAKIFNGAGEVDNAGTAYSYAWAAVDSNNAATVFRSVYYHATTLSASVAAAATTISVAAVGTAANINSLDLGDYLVIDPGLTTEEIIQVHTVTAITGTGPYVVTLATGIAQVGGHASGAVVRVIKKKPITTTVSGGGNGLTITTATVGFKASATAPALEIVRIGAGDTAVYRKVISVSGAGPYTLTLDLAVGAVNGLALVRATELQYGKSITVNADDVAVKNTFTCMVS